MQGENISTPIYLNVIRCIYQRFVFKNSGFLVPSQASLDLQLEPSRTTILFAKKLVAGWETTQVMYSFFLHVDMNLWFGG